MRLFTSDPEVVEVGTTYIQIMVFIQWAYVMTFLHTGYLQAVKRPMYGFVESVIRKIILPIVVFNSLVTVVGVTVVEFFYAMVAINVLMTVATIMYAQYILRRSLRNTVD